MSTENVGKFTLFFRAYLSDSLIFVSKISNSILTLNYGAGNFVESNNCLGLGAVFVLLGNLYGDAALDLVGGWTVVSLNLTLL